MPYRDPSIHITKSEMVKLFKKLLPEGTKVEGLVTQVFKQARPYSLNNRVVIASSDRLEYKTKRTLSSPTVDADLMARTIYMVRRKMKHIGVTQIKPASREWSMVKEITARANEFCIDTDLSKKAGYIQYIEIALSKMAKPSIQKIPSMHSAICETYMYLKEIREDTNSEFTLKVHEYYRMKVATKTGMVNNFKNVPDKYVYFVRASKLIRELTVGINVYIDSQFEAMDYRGALPDPIQLVGQKAKERLNKYMFEHNIDLRKNGNHKPN